MKTVVNNMDFGCTLVDIKGVNKNRASIIYYTPYFLEVKASNKINHSNFNKRWFQVVFFGITLPFMNALIHIILL